jgi:hypothetical protein
MSNLAFPNVKNNRVKLYAPARHRACLLVARRPCAPDRAIFVAILREFPEVRVELAVNDALSELVSEGYDLRAFVDFFQAANRSG